MPAWVHAAERAYVAAAVHVRPPDDSVRLPDASTEGVRASHGHAGDASSPAAPAAQVRAPDASANHVPSDATTRAHALAAAGAIASHYLAVGTPRSFGILIDDPTDVEAAALSLAAHRAWFNPRDIRCASSAPGDASASGADALAAATGGRVVSLAEALACDIANVYGASIAITPALLRRGTHVNALHADRIDPELAQLATLVRETGLPALAAGLVDGRQLDELTIFVVDGAPIALAALGS